MDREIVGIIGGVGTAATDNFCSILTSLTPAQTDQQHLERILHNNSKIPDRTVEIEKILQKEMSIQDSLVVQEMVRSIHILHNAGASFYVSPCNAIHYFLSETLHRTSTQLAEDIEFINIIVEVAKHCNQNNWRKVGLLATRGTIISNIYSDVCREYAIEVVAPEEWGIANIMDAVYGLKDGKNNGLGIKNSVANHQSPRNKQLFMEVIQHFLEEDVDGIILGCTEIPLCLSQEDLPDLPLINSIVILAQTCVNKVVGQGEVEMLDI